MAALAFGLVGSAFGSMVGLPSLGFTVGSALGGLLFPSKQPDTFGPQMGDLSVTSSAYGADIPYGFGTMRIAGNVIWASPIQEVVNESKQSSGKGGKGGKSSGGTTTEYTYFGNWAVGFAHGPAEKVTRIWFDGVLVYNSIDAGGIDGNGTLNQVGLNFRFYPGDEVQVADPLIEAWIAIGNVSPPDTKGTFESGSTPSTPAGEPSTVTPGSQAVPGHRGLCYIVFENWCLTNSGNHLPMVTAEITFSIDPNYPYTPLDPIAVESEANFNSQPDSLIANSGTGVDLIRHSAFRASIGDDGAVYLRRFDQSTMQETRVVPMMSLDGTETCVERTPLGIGSGGTDDANPLVSGNVSSLICAPDGKLYIWGPSDSTGLGDHSGLILQVDENSMKETARVDMGHVFGLVLPGGIFHWGFVPEFNDSMVLHWFLCPQIYDGRMFAIDVGPTHFMQFVPVGGAGQADSGTAWAGGGAAHVEPTWAPGTPEAWSFAPPNAGLFGNKGMGVFPDPTLIHPAIGFWGGGGNTFPIEIYGVDPKNAFAVQYADLYPADIFPLADVVPSDYSGGMSIAHDPWMDISTAAFIWSVRSVPSGEECLVCWDVATNSVRWVTNLTAQGISTPNGDSGSYMQSALTNERLYWETGAGGLFGSVTGINTLDGTIVLAAQPWPDSVPITSTDQVWDGYQSAITSGYGEVKIFVDRHDPKATTVGSIVRALCEKVGLDPVLDLDTTELDDITIDGYFVGQPTSVRDAILPLAQAYLFDAVESDGRIKFPLRGKSITRTLTQDRDLAPVDAKTNLVVLETRQQEVDLPVYLAVSYYDVNNNYQQGTRIRRRSQVPNQSDVSGAQNAPTVHTQNIAQLQWPIVLDAQKATEAADKYLFATWLERTQFKQTIHWGHLDLDPSDVVRVELNDGTSYTERLTKLVIGADLTMEADGTSENAAVYDPNVAGGNGTELSVVPIGSGPSFTKLILLPTPLLLDTDSLGQTNSVLYYGATNYSAASFPGCAVFKSTDQTTWLQMSIDNYKVKWGSTLSSLPDNDDPFSFDETTRLVVLMANGATLENATEAELLTGGNAMAVFNTDGNPEIIQFGTATPNGDGSYTLSHLLRGRRGTDTWCANHSAGRDVVLLQAPQIRNFFIGAGEVGQTRFYRGVGNGLTIDFADTETLTSEGNDLKPYAPRHVAATAGRMAWDPTFSAAFNYSTDRQANDRAVKNSGGWATARSAGVLQPGLWYFESPKEFITITASVDWGLCSPAMASTTEVGSTGDGIRIVPVDLHDGFTTLRFAVDGTAQKAWYRYDDYDYGDPETDSRPARFSPLRGTTLYLAFGDNFSGTIGSTMNPGSSAFAAPAPAGFDPWGAGDTWNTAFPVPGDFTFSGGDRTATATGAAFVVTAIGTVGHSTGRYYAEFQLSSPFGSTYLGLAPATQGNRNRPDQPDNVSWRSDGAREFSLRGVLSGTGMPAPSPGDWIGFAWDLDRGYAWVRNATADPSKWYGVGTTLGLLGWLGAGAAAGDPVAGTNGIDFSSLGPDVHFCYSSVNGNDDARIYSRPADLSYSPPGTYSAGVPDGSIALSWIRRTRINGELLDGTGEVPLNEDSEEYDVDVMDAPGTGTVVRAISSLTSPSATYDAADVATDWSGLPDTLTLRVYQISGAVGRGFTEEVEVTVA